MDKNGVVIEINFSTSTLSFCFCQKRRNSRLVFHKTKASATSMRQPLQKIAAKVGIPLGL